MAHQYLAEGKWPVWQYVVATLDRRDLDTEALLCSLPRVGFTGHIGPSYGLASHVGPHLAEGDRLGVLFISVGDVTGPWDPATTSAAAEPSRTAPRGGLRGPPRGPGRPLPADRGAVERFHRAPLEEWAYLGPAPAPPSGPPPWPAFCTPTILAATPRSAAGPRSAVPTTPRVNTSSAVTGNVHRVVAAEQRVPIFVSCRVGSALLWRGDDSDDHSQRWFQLGEVRDRTVPAGRTAGSVAGVRVRLVR